MPRLMILNWEVISRLNAMRAAFCLGMAILTISVLISGKYVNLGGWLGSERGKQGGGKHLQYIYIKRARINGVSRKTLAIRT